MISRNAVVIGLIYALIWVTQAALAHLGVTGARVSLVGRNLLTFSDYRGFDPEVGITGGQLNNAALNAVDSFGFPNVRSFTLQLQTAFDFANVFSECVET